MSGCTGHCCRAIGIAIPPEDLALIFDLLVATLERDGMDEQLSDALMVATMLVPMGVHDNIHPVTGRRGVNTRHWYTCVHYDDDEGRCLVYEYRPNLCRSYPNGKPCEEPECTWTDAAEQTRRKKTTRLPVITSEMRAGKAPADGDRVVGRSGAVGERPSRTVGEHNKTDT